MAEDKMLSRNNKRLLELVVINLGVIEKISMTLRPGMSVITGETGAGKTLLVTALQLLTGQRAESTAVGPFGDEARVEARCIIDNEETIVTRVVPKEGRSRAYINGSMVTVGSLAEVADSLIEIHGQHGHTALESPKEQRKALDEYGSIDISNLKQLQLNEKNLKNDLEKLLGKEKEKTDLDYLKFQEREITEANIHDLEEVEHLKEVEKLLADATGNQLAALRISEDLNNAGQIVEGITVLLNELRNRESMKHLEEKIIETLELISAISIESRDIAEQIDTSPERLNQVQERRSILTELRRKYGESLEAVLEKQKQLQEEIKSLEKADVIAATMETELGEITEQRKREEARIGKEREKAAPNISSEIQATLRDLALPNAQVKFTTDGPAGNDIKLLLSLNRGQEMMPIQKIASGGELSRTMLALRLVLSAETGTLVFDEVDSGIGGETAHSIGSALKRLAKGCQVLVVTHLAQVAAFADTQIMLTKTNDESKVGIDVKVLNKEERVIEISRMLSGSPDSLNARKHAEELLEKSRM